MANEVNVDVAADGSSVVTEFDRIGNAAIDMSRQARRAGEDTEEAFDNAARSTGRLGESLDTAQGGLGQLGEAFDGVGQSATAVQDIMQHSERKASELARAQLDVEQAANDASQALEDMNQALRDQAQSEIDATQADQDAEQALLDKEKAQKDLNEAIKEFGPKSQEARQARLDMAQAEIDHTQAVEDGKQAQRDAAQALIDSKQAATDLKTANLDAADSNRQLQESGSALTAVAEWGGMLSGVVSGLTGVLGIVTIAQWAWNASLLANPITWIVALIVGLIAVIVLVATKTKFFQTIWKNVWGWAKNFIGDQFSNIKTIVTVVIGTIVTVVRNLPGRIRSVLSRLTGFLSAPFKAAFNAIASAWNNTVGRLSFSIPSWVPGIGGSSFSMPNIPHMATGGDVLRTGLAVVHAGEKVIPAAKAKALSPYADPARRSPSGGWDIRNIRSTLELKPSGRDPFEDILVEYLRNNARVRAVVDDGIREKVITTGNGSVQVAYGRRGSR